jgi:serine/threonine protein kinase
VRPRQAGASLGAGYEVIGLLWRSRVLDVYDAWSHERGCRVVVKTLRPDRRDDARAVRALRREGRHLARLSHPHLVRAYAVLDAPHPAVVLETLGGETVAHLIERRARGLAARELGILGLQVCGAAGYLHAHGIVHLDIKPSNVVLDGGRAKLIDLSVAQRFGACRPGTGTWCYLAPEQARGDAVGPAADVWGIGLLLREAATGECPFDNRADGDREHPQLGRRARSVRSERRGLPRVLGAAMDAALAPDPAQRPSVGELAAACAQAAGLEEERRRLAAVAS